MNRFLVNSTDERLENLFREAWKREIEKLAKTNSFPKLPGVGWLQNYAAKKNICMATFQHPDGSHAICGRSLKSFASPDPWYCSKCYEMRKKIEEENAKDDLPF